jgi:hypothetical protein
MVLPFLLVTVEQSGRRIYMMTFLFAGLPAATVTFHPALNMPELTTLNHLKQTKKEPGLLRAP